jgi:hypothetical protein
MNRTALIRTRTLTIGCCENSPLELDAIDHRIVSALRAEGRISNVELAERVGALIIRPSGRRSRERIADTPDP